VQVSSAEMKREKKKDGLLSSLSGLLNPFSEKDNARLNCAILNFKIKDGIATANKGIGLETDQITVLGGGEINLKNEKLALGFEPHAKGAVAGTLTNLASGMSAGGTLANPKIKINPAGVAMGAIKSVVGAPGSIVGGLFGKGDSDAANDSPCQTALTGKSTSTQSKKTNTIDTDKVKSATKDALKDPKKLLKGLFN
jgi:AsmA family protein